VLGGAWVTPAFIQSVPEARQNSSTRFGTMSSAVGRGCFGDDHCSQSGDRGYPPSCAR
jgi:hypothetical protein